jgi:hypothetical protein
MFIVRWGPENAWGTAFGKRERADQHAADLRERWPDVEVVEMDQ